MKKILSLILTIFLVLGMTIVYAQEEDNSELDSEDGGVAPDSAFYGLDRALERIDLLITLGRAAKAKKGLDHARERLMEARKLVKENKFEHLERLKLEHKESVEKIKLELKGIESENPEGSLEEEVEIEAEVESQENQLDAVTTDLELKFSGQLTDEQAAKLKDFLNSLGNDVSNVKLRIKDGKNAIKVRLRERTDKSEREVDDIEKELERKHRLDEVREEAVEKALERLEKKLEKLKEITQKHKERERDVSEMETRLEKVEEIIAELKARLESNDFEKVKELIHEANRLLNFSEAFRALESNDKERLARVAASNREDLNRLKLRIKEREEELKDKRMEIKERAMAVKEVMKKEDSSGSRDEEDKEGRESESLEVNPSN